MSLSALKFYDHSAYLVVSRLLSKSAVVLCLLSLSTFSTVVQAASTEQTPNATASLKLINLQANDTTIANGIDDFSDFPETQTSRALEDSDAVGDETFIDNENYGDDDLSNDDTAIQNPILRSSNGNVIDATLTMPKVSLKAISPETLKTFVAVIDLVRRNYVNTVNDETLFDNAMSGMLTKLDNNAEFLDAEAYDNLRAFTQGDVGDVGIKAAYKADLGYWVVTEVVEDSPADKKGITVGSYIYQIGEFKLEGDRQSNDVEQLLTGIAGSQVDIVISKAGRRKQAITLQRNNMNPQNLQTKLIEGIAVIKLPAFQDNSRENIIQSLIDLNAPITGVLIDLRDNPGGVLTSAIDIASLFMSDANVVQVKGRQGSPSILTTSGSAILASLPVAILQNRYSASAAEVLASSLQTQKRAIIIGETSYGKGSIQSVIPVNNEQAVKLTVAYYLTANGSQIDKIGVQPDIILSGNEGLWQHQAINLLKKQVRTAGIRISRKANSDNLPSVLPK